MEDAVKTGLAGTQYADRILPCQSVTLMEREAQGRLIPGDVNIRIIGYISAILEVEVVDGCDCRGPDSRFLWCDAWFDVGGRRCHGR